MTLASTPVASPTAYTVYGLTLLSDVPLRELPLASQPPDNATYGVRFSLRHEPMATPLARELRSRTLPNGEPWLACIKFEGGYVLQFANLADFYIDTLGCKISCHPVADLLPKTLSHLLLDHVLPLVLNVRGQDALHATAVLTPHGVCAFTGITGMGKSTLAASFHQAGYPILSDDCLVLQPNRSQLIAVPSYPGLRLWRDSLDALGIRQQPTQPVAHYTTKQRLLTPNWPNIMATIPETRRALVAIYSLIRQPIEDSQPDARLYREQLTRRAALMELLPHVFRMDVTDQPMLIRQLDLLEQVVTQVPVYRLHFPSSFTTLDTLREAILTELA